LESALRKLRICNLKAQVDLWRLRNEFVAWDFDRASTNEQKSATALEWENAIKAKQAAQLLLDRLETRGLP
jgi:hypothetical protein